MIKILKRKKSKQTILVDRVMLNLKLIEPSNLDKETYELFKKLIDEIAKKEEKIVIMNVILPISLAIKLFPNIDITNRKFIT